MPNSSTDDSTVDFSKKFSQLQEIVDYFESDVTDIEESLKKFEEGVKLSNELKEYLNSAKNKVETIKANFNE